MKRMIACLSVLILVCSLYSVSFAKGGPAGSPGAGSGAGTGSGSGSGGDGSGSGGGDVGSPDLGDLIIVLRDDNGVPIPSTAGCPLQPLNILGIPIPLDVECEIVTESLCDIEGGCLPVEVDFGRTSVARSPEDVMEKSFDEVIATIKESKGVSVDPAGRLILEMEVLNVETNVLETINKTIDSPLENLALYTQVMRTGHIQTADGVISDSHGDEITIRPALDPLTDYAKFSTELMCLLPTPDGSIAPEALSNCDLLFSSFFLAGASDKTGEITVDMVQYLNRILEIPNSSNSLVGNPSFVDFGNFSYQRNLHFSKNVEVIQEGDVPDTWQKETVNLMTWLEHANGYQADGNNIAGFVRSANEGLEVILFIHNYELPENLWQ
ncbi:MAG: hypothetical protein ACWGHO_00700 [Candidatus Moraniibacteriota bacterium]